MPPQGRRVALTASWCLCPTSASQLDLVVLVFRVHSFVRSFWLFRTGIVLLFFFLNYKKIHPRAGEGAQLVNRSRQEQESLSLIPVL